MPYITLEGNIGVGKSTLLHELADELGWEAVEEGIESDPTFKMLLRERYEFPCDETVGRLQLYIADFMARRIAALDPDKYYVVERSVFATQLFSLAAGRDDLVDALAGHVIGVKPPEFYLYLSAPPKLCYERVKKRDREGECGVSLGYLERLHQVHERWYHSMAMFRRVKRVDCFDYPDVKAVAELVRHSMLK